MARPDTENIVNALSFLATKIKFYASLNLQDVNIHTENIFRDILNITFQDRTFKNLNTLEDNFTAIDLGDDKNEMAFQVTSTTSRKKVEETLLKYKEEYNFKKVVMLYAVMEKPTRTKKFDDLIDKKFDFDEWDLTDLNKKINDCKSEDLQEIQNIFLRDVLPQINNSFLSIDSSGIDEWPKIESTDVRNFKDKILAVNGSIREARINKYCRDIASGKVELSKHSDRFVSAMKFRIFEVCQEELMDFCDSFTEGELSNEQIKNLIERYTDKAVEVIEDKSKDYNYPLKNRDILRKIVLALIDECYLSFDYIGIYE